MVLATETTIPTIRLAGAASRGARPRPRPSLPDIRNAERSPEERDPLDLEENSRSENSHATASYIRRMTHLPPDHSKRVHVRDGGCPA